MTIEAFDRVHLDGTGIDRITEDEVVAVVRESLARGRGGRIITPNVDILRRAAADPGVRRHLDDADLIVADGMPLVWASRLGGVPLPERVAGSSLIWSLSEGLGRDARSVFVIGGTPAAPAAGPARGPATRATLRSPEHGAAGTPPEPAGSSKSGRSAAVGGSSESGMLAAVGGLAGIGGSSESGGSLGIGGPVGTGGPAKSGGSAGTGRSAAVGGPVGIGGSSESGGLAEAGRSAGTGRSAERGRPAETGSMRRAKLGGRRSDKPGVTSAAVKAALGAAAAVKAARHAGKDGAARAAARLAQACPGLRIAGTLSPDYGFEEDEATYADFCAAVVAAEPDLVFVGLGFPKQELVIERLRPELPKAWFVGCGAAVNFVAGDVERAPRWMQRTGLEWAHRLGVEPRRLAGRYLRHDAPYTLRLLARAPRRRTLRS